jgi:hypothetical protein
MASRQKEHPRDRAAPWQQPKRRLATNPENKGHAQRNRGIIEADLGLPAGRTRIDLPYRERAPRILNTNLIQVSPHISHSRRLSDR